MRERRKAVRYLFGGRARLHEAGGGVGANVVVRVISMLGCSLEGAQGPAIGKKCELYFDWQGAQVGLEAVVTSRDVEGRLGLKFLLADKNIEKRLRDLCGTLSSQPSPSPLKPAEKAPSGLRFSTGEAPPVPPTAPHERERRRVPRYISELRAQLSNPASGLASRVTLITVSVLGGCVEGSGLPEPGVTCELKTEWEGKPLVIQAEAVWKRNGQLGLKFVPLGEASDKLLRQICANMLLQPLAPMPPEPQ